MRLRRFTGLLATFAMMHVVLVGGEVECVHSPNVAVGPGAHEMGPGDCDHPVTTSNTVPRSSHGIPGRHTREHGALCCAALAGCAIAISAAESVPTALHAARSSGIASVELERVPAPRFPPDPPPPKA